MVYLNRNVFCLSRRFLSLSESARQWLPVIGIEVHAQIDADTKLFSGASTRFGAQINSQVAAFDAALPGTLPVINRRCVEAGVKTAIALESQINMTSTFDRKHYFYSDLPAGYQITQQRRPLAQGGQLAYVTVDSKSKRMVEKVARITQIQLEQDSGKSLHDVHSTYSLIDLNRAGAGLMEIITEPDFSCGQDAAMFVKDLQRLLVVIGACDGKMAEGSLRVDASVSIHKRGQPLGVRTEIKNLNSTRMLAKAIEFEIERQIKLVDNGGVVFSETRSFDPDTGETIVMRDKERLHDYRFVPEPNLPPLRLSAGKNMAENGQWLVSVSEVSKSLPRLPHHIRHSLCLSHSLTLEQANTLQCNEAMLPYFAQVIEANKSRPGACVFAMVNQLMAVCNRLALDFTNCGVSVEQIGEVVDLVTHNKLSRQTAELVVEELLTTDIKSVQAILERHDWGELVGEREVEDACQAVLSRHPETRVKYTKEKGRQRALTFLVKQVLTQLNNQVDAGVVVRTLQRLLQQPSSRDKH